MSASLKRKIRKIISPIRKIGLKNRDFSIISNNCWGGYVYDTFGLKYNTPTIGLYIFSDDYIKFISNLRHYLSLDAKVLSIEDSKYKHILKNNGKKIMLGIVDDIELVFVHYESAEEAVKKWNKRRTRVDYSNLLIKFNDQNLFNDQNFIEFNNMKCLNKLFFTANEKYCKKDYCFQIKKYEKYGYVLDDIKSSSKIMNIKKFLNNLNRDKEV